MNRSLLAALVFSLFGCTTVRQAREHASLKPDGHAERTRTKDALDYSVAISIAAPPEVVWSLITDRAGYARWSSTVVRLDGQLEKDGKLALVSKDAPDRTFDLKVTTFEAPKKMVWEDGSAMFLGVRTFTVTASGSATVFAMSETFSGGLLGMIEGKLPDFTRSFETFAADLKREAERTAHR